MKDQKKRIMLICALAVLVLALIAWAVWPKGGKAPEQPQPTEVPATEIPATEVPTTEVPATADPATEIPATELPTTDAPAQPVSGEPVPEDAVLATVNGKPITAMEADDVAYSLYQYGYASNYPDYAAAVEYLIQQAVIENHLRSGGYYSFTEEEEAAFANEASAEWEDAIAQYITTNLTEDTEENRAQLRQQAEAYYTSGGITQDVLVEQLRRRAATDKLETELAGDYAPTEEEINEVFTTVGARYQQQYENDIQTYELYTQYYGYESWYVPEGFRAVLHILLDVDETLMQAYTDAQAALEELQGEEGADEAKVNEAKQALEEARAAVIASRQETIDDIYARMEKGESFQSLISEYNTDPGMQDEATLAKGYYVHPDSFIWDSAFTAAAFDEKMQKPGDTSNPVVSSFGIHVLYYLGDVPGGLNMTDEIREEITDYLEDVHLNSAYSEGYAQWSQLVEITRDEEMIARLTAEVQAEQEALSQTAAPAEDVSTEEPAEEPAEEDAPAEEPAEKPAAETAPAETEQKAE